MTNGHAFLPPSGASSWSLCAMWPTMNARYPQESEVSAVEGSAAHEVAWMMFNKQPVKAGDKIPPSSTATEEMIEGAELLCDTIQALNASGIHHYVEKWLPANIIHEKCSGRPDYWIWDHNKQSISIIDYKFGFRFVDEFFNPQGLIYLAAIIEFLSSNWQKTWDQFPLSTQVSFTIVQPRCYYRGLPVRTHNFTVLQAVEHFNRLRAAAEASLVAEPLATTNPNCIYCPGRHACSALQLAAYSDAEMSNSRTPLELSPVAAALELRFLIRAFERLEARIDGLKELTIANMKRGEPIPYFHIEPGFGRTVWKIPNTQIIEIGRLFGKDLSKQETVTPKQAIQMGIPEAVVNGSSMTPTTATKLIPEKSTDAAKVFGR